MVVKDSTSPPNHGILTSPIESIEESNPFRWSGPGLPDLTHCLASLMAHFLQPPQSKIGCALSSPREKVTMHGIRFPKGRARSARPNHALAMDSFCANRAVAFLLSFLGCLYLLPCLEETRGWRFC